MKRLLTTMAGAFALAMAAQPALAADIPARAPAYKASVAAPLFNWSGFYAGGHLGYGWGRSALHDLDNFGLGIGPDPFQIDRYRFDGIVGGGQVGYNWQTGNWVSGVEFDFSFSGMKEKTPPIRTTLTINTDINWFGTGRLRFGYAADRTLFYVTGGFAYADVDNSLLDPGFASTGVSDVRWGWTIGGGLEYAFANWTVRGEYLFVDLEDSRRVTSPPSIGRFEWENRFHVARVALNYRFATGKAPGPVITKY